MATIQNTLRGRQEGVQAPSSRTPRYPPLPGDPFRKEGAQFYPLFELTLPKEHWRDLSEENEVGSKED